MFRKSAADPTKTSGRKTGCLWISRLLIGLGLLLCMIPALWPLISNHQAARSIAGYRTQASALNSEAWDQILNQASEWNALLAGKLGAGTPRTARIGEYEEQMQFFEDGIMAVLRIPRLDLSLPVYHGVEEEALSRGAGHLPSSSLPVGSTPGRAVLSAHRGLLQAELFTRLDELKPDDLFFIELPGRTLAYQVFETEVILPEDHQALALREGEDLVTLMTCTPYGINDHRLLVTGRRTIWNRTSDRIQKQISFSSFSLREWIFRLWPWSVLVFFLAHAGYRKMRSRKESV